MKVFLSWSGERSRQVAESLKSWLPDVIQEVDPWISTQDIAKGGRGVREITNELATTDFGIVCVTPENEASKWINFEAGALSKQFEIAHVVPFLIDMKIADLTGPLAQFQATVGGSRHDVRKLVGDINKASTGRVVAEDRLDRAFTRSWPELERAIQDIRGASPREGLRHSVERSEAEMLEEILLLVRNQEYRQVDMEGKVTRVDEKLSRNRRISEEEFIVSSFAKIGWRVLGSSWGSATVSITAQCPEDGSLSLSRDFIERVAKSLGRPVIVMGESGNVIVRSSGLSFS